MSEGPIKQWRDSFKVPPASTNPRTAVHGFGSTAGTSYCGRRKVQLADWAGVTCSDCHAARNADLAAAHG